ncbi:hypothetical protein EIP91_005230 [Steccherinum ochraceum]|uniref:Alcohol dehydrogenase-like C-terminal domain-containing protein n=1 Tax=Steccherinum ochraceum TaxID=92696 RepID=A0A4R0RFS9_9APHY|nr:hypothetical protein EIP91_005230 [Steccherinum ochraceum]
MKSIGATPIDRNLPLAGLAAAITAITTEPMRLVFDAISSDETQNVALDLTAPGGLLILVLASHVTDDRRKASPDKEVVHTLGIPHLPSNRDLAAEVYELLPGWFESGDLTPTETEYIAGGLAAIPAALDRLREGLVGPRKMVVRPPETH